MGISVSAVGIEEKLRVSELESSLGGRNLESNLMSHPFLYSDASRTISASTRSEDPSSTGSDISIEASEGLDAIDDDMVRGCGEGEEGKCAEERERERKCEERPGELSRVALLMVFDLEIDCFEGVDGRLGGAVPMEGLMFGSSICVVIPSACFGENNIEMR